MKKLHIEFDCIVTDKSAKELSDAPDICLCDNIAEALEITDECECVTNLKIIDCPCREKGGENE